MNNKNIKINILGKKNFSRKLNLLLKNVEKETFNNSSLQINLALNYGSKSEIIEAFRNIYMNKKKITEKNLSKYLYTKDIPDPELLIRTGNTK